jgi:hypothetical protein
MNQKLIEGAAKGLLKAGIGHAIGQHQKSKFAERAARLGEVKFISTCNIIEKGDWYPKEGNIAIAGDFVVLSAHSKQSIKKIDLQFHVLDLTMTPKRGKILFLFDGYSFLFHMLGRHYEIGIEGWGDFVRILGRGRILDLEQHPEVLAVFGEE